MKKLNFLIYAVGSILLGISCTKYDIDPTPVAKFSIAKTTYNVLEQVHIENEGSGEYFAYWPGDEGHNYALRSNGTDKGLIPNEGRNFNYSYLFTGTYTMVVIASSYNEDNQTRTERVDSVKITVVSGTSGNVIESIELYNCVKGYNAIGKFIGTDSILFPIDYVNRANAIPDSDYINIVNKRNFIFTASLFAEVYGDDHTLLTGMVDDTYQSNLIEPVSYNPLVYHSRIGSLTVVGQGNITREYKIAAMFYPEMLTFSASGKPAIKYSTSGLLPDADSLDFISMYSDSSYFGIKIKTTETQYETVPTFTTTPGCTVTLDGVSGEQISGVTKVMFVKNKPLLYRVTRNENGFKLITKVVVYVK
jgi:hypothetical protein